MKEYREVEFTVPSRPTIEGAGVHLFRAFGPREVPMLDPFLMLDDFHSRNPEDYIAGFPWHPHRGIETVTYMIRGTVEHGDSIGNSGVILSGDVQWMTAGNGILHQEMPARYDGLMQGFQLWVNLPRTNKMMDPRYRDVGHDTIPTANPADGVEVKVIAGKIAGVTGPVRDLVVKTSYLDVSIKPGKAFEQIVPKRDRAFAYVFEGSGTSGKTAFRSGSLVVFKGEGSLRVLAGQEGIRMITAWGEPLHEPVAWGGPIVMNTDDELRLAFEELEAGTFIKTRSPT